ncbi:hypothetical protein J7E71_12210 [Mesobacillus foraminis]|uniref:Ig-like domain-containing protein n=1 Tax=Mesobacillus foraminis TaxID=279826 RepID=UPI001BEAD6D9|nr:Ig-like domain-containing protein [Mesobacillus foraminis]MBT2756719.1 hypothetical protein [Mesobacillus foraminis]
MKRLFTLLLAALFIFTFSFSDVAESATEFEDNDSFGTATQLSLAKNSDGTYTSKVTGTISNSYDDDYYMISLPNPGKLSVKLDRKVSTKFSVKLYNVKQERLEYYYTEYNDAKGVIEVFAQGLDKGVYYISVEYYDGSSAKVPYTLQLDFTQSNVYERENNDDRSQANWIGLNTLYNGYADDSDYDYYAFKIDKPGEIKIDLNSNPQTRYRMELLTNNGTNLETWYTYYGDNYNLINIIHTGLAAGNYYLKITAYDGETENVPYNFKINYSANTFFEQEDNDSESNANPTKLNTQYKGVISHDSDYDYYRVNVPKNMHLALYLTRPSDTRYRVRVYNQSYSFSETYYSSYGNNALSHFMNLDLKAGTYFINVSHYDGEDNTVPYSLKLIERDITPPAAPKVNAVSDKSTTLSGTAEANSTVYLQVGSKVVKKATVNKDGKFSFSISKYKGGTTLVVFAKDSSGNQSKSTSIKVKDTTPPAAPKINTVTDKSTKITGTAEANSTVYLKVGSKVIKNTKADKYGKYSISISKYKAGTTLTLYAKDASDNTSKSASTKVKDATAPKAPTVNKVTTKSTYVTGKTEPKAKITIKSGSKTIAKGSADSKGNFKVKISKQKKNTKLSVYSADASNNVSAARTVYVK